MRLFVTYYLDEISTLKQGKIENVAANKFIQKRTKTPRKSPPGWTPPQQLHATCPPQCDPVLSMNQQTKALIKKIATMKLMFSYFLRTFINLAISDWLSWCLSTLLCITSWTFFWKVRLFKNYELVMHMMVLKFSCTCICWVMKLWKTIWIGKLWLTRTGPCLTHTLSQHGALSLDIEVTSRVQDSS